MQNPPPFDPNEDPNLSRPPAPSPEQSRIPYQSTAPFQPTPGDPVSTAVIGEAWEIIKPQLGMWVVAMLICGAVSGVFNGISSVVSALGGENPSAVVVVLLLLLSLAGFVVGFLVNAGLYKMAIHHVRTGQADIGKLFDITDVVAPVIIASLLAAIASALGFIACIIPGILISLLLLMAVPIVVDQKADAVDALKLSWDVSKPHLGALVILAILLGLLNIVGACACFVGLLVTYPLTFMAFAVVYRNLFGINPTPLASSASPFPPPPISDPRG